METDANEIDTEEPIKFEKCSSPNGRSICRICLQSETLAVCENMVSLFSPLNTNIRINEALAICFGLEIFQEQVSSIGNKICSHCTKQLEATYNFRRLCWASQLKLNGTLSRLDDRNDGTATKSQRVSVATMFSILNEIFIVNQNLDSTTSHQ